MPDNLKCLSSTKEDLDGSYNEPQVRIIRRVCLFVRSSFVRSFVHFLCIAIL